LTQERAESGISYRQLHPHGGSFTSAADLRMLIFRRVLVAMIIFILLSVGALLGLVTGLFVLRVMGIVLISLSVALLSVLILLDHGFGVVRSGLISVGSLTALQGSYLVGVWISLNFGLPLKEFAPRARWLSGATRRRPMTVGEDGGSHEGLDPSYTRAAQKEPECTARRSQHSGAR
jgi:hypothetical protein